MRISTVRYGPVACTASVSEVADNSGVMTDPPSVRHELWKSATENGTDDIIISDLDGEVIA